MFCQRAAPGPAEPRVCLLAQLAQTLQPPWWASPSAPPLLPQLVISKLPLIDPQTLFVLQSQQLGGDCLCSILISFVSFALNRLCP